VCEREAARVLRNPIDRDDAVQEALTRAWVHRASCRTPLAPDPWVRQIARREALRLAVRQRVDRERRADCDSAAGRAEDSAAIVRRLDVHEALRALAPAERRLVVLRYYGDLSYGQLADALDMPEGTAKVRLHRVRKRLAPLACDP
jgi:RNA polymerase sigma-70 factor (ECF subfamily)